MTTMRFALLALLFLGACAPAAPSADRLAAFADVLSADEYAVLFLDELETRLDTTAQALTETQREALYPVLVAGAEAQRALIRSNTAPPGPALQARSEEIAAQTDAEAEALLAEPQRPVYRALRVEALAAIRQELDER